MQQLIEFLHQFFEDLKETRLERFDMRSLKRNCNCEFKKGEWKNVGYFSSIISQLRKEFSLPENWQEFADCYYSHP
jgi:hypothetical protein